MLYKSLWVVDNREAEDVLSKYTDSRKTFAKGSFVYDQNDERQHLLYLVEGRMKVSVFSHDGSEKTLAIHEPGSFFGETAFFDSKPSFSTAQALEKSVVLMFDREQLMSLFSDHPEIVFHLFESMGRKIRLLTFQVEYLSFMNIDQRAVALLLSLFDVFGKSCDQQCENPSSEESLENSESCGHGDGSLLELTITDQELADMIGTRREAVTKAINKLKKTKLIYKRKRTICCPSISRLNEFISE
ncbi:MAG: Crp/Fnr family transcriptional regulator [Tindallia sp. MSAO_Bac2]|nr:MAG: Crp/Fnr family transcriptional regulator [Tindallia sp. MSAO_Bac2]